MRRAGLLTIAIVAYLVAAWIVAPGFYDGFGPLVPYNWVCPPPNVGANMPPSSGHRQIKVVGGISDADAAYTDPDTQVVIDFLPGSFNAAGKTVITVDIKPVSPCPKPAGLTFATNTHLITADAPLVKTATLVMHYSDLVPAPSAVYYAASVDGPWTSIGAGSQAAPFTIQAGIKEFGYYAAGYPANSVAHSAGGNQLIPIAVAVLILAVLVAGIPLAMVRRRRATDDGDEDGSEP